MGPPNFYSGRGSLRTIAPLAEVIRARFHRAALDELETDWARHTDIQPKLGEAFVDSIEQALNLAREFPEMGSPYRYGTRRVFP